MWYLFVIIAAFYCALVVPFVGFLIEGDLFGGADTLPILHYYKLGLLAHVAVVVLCVGLYSAHILAHTT